MSVRRHSQSPRDTYRRTEKSIRFSRGSRPTQFFERRSDDSLRDRPRLLSVIRKKKIPCSEYITKDIEERYLKPGEIISTQKLRLLMRDSRDSLVKQYGDSLDWSNTPSYSKIPTPYHLICRERYRKAKKNYEEQFQKEIQQLIENQSMAFEAVCMVRVLAITSLWPPFHSHRLIDESRQKFFRLSPSQRSRLNYIMRVDWHKTQ